MNIFRRMFHRLFGPRPAQPIAAMSDKVSRNDEAQQSGPGLPRVRVINQRGAFCLCKFARRWKEHFQLRDVRFWNDEQIGGGAVAQGEFAFASLRPWNACPYRRTNPARRLWLAGWWRASRKARAAR